MLGRAIEARGGGRGFPRFVEKELKAHLRCGVLEAGFARFHCDRCGLDRLVAFSCKGRGFCPSCGGRRMAALAAHLEQAVLPAMPVRQWVLSLPFPLRYRLASDHALACALLRVAALLASIDAGPVARAILRHLGLLLEHERPARAPPPETAASSDYAIDPT